MRLPWPPSEWVFLFSAFCCNIHNSCYSYFLETGAIVDGKVRKFGLLYVANMKVAGMNLYGKLNQGKDKECADAIAESIGQKIKTLTGMNQ